MTGELSLGCQVEGLHIGGLVVVLPAVEIDAGAVHLGRIGKVDRGKRVFHRGCLAIREKQRSLRARRILGNFVDEWIVSSQGSAVAKVAQSSVGDSISAAHHQHWR